MSSDNQFDKKSADEHDGHQQAPKLNDKFIIKGHQRYDSDGQGQRDQNQDQNQLQKSISHTVNDSLDRNLANLEGQNHEQEQVIVPQRQTGRGNRASNVESKENKKNNSSSKTQQKPSINDSGSWDNQNQDKKAANQKQKSPQRTGRNQRNVQKEDNDQKPNQKLNQSNWDQEVPEQKKSKPQQKGRGRGRKQQSNQPDDQKQLSPDKTPKQDGQQNWSKQVTDKPQLTTRGRGNRGNRDNQTRGNENGQQQRGNRPQRDYQRRQFNPNGFGNNRYGNHQNTEREGQSWGNQHRDFNNRGRGGFRGGDRGGRGGFNRGNRDQQRGANNGYPNSNRNFQDRGGRGNRQEGQGRFPQGDNHRNFQNKSNLPNQNNQIPVYNAVSIIEPKGDVSWPQISLYLKKCKVSLSLKNLSDLSADSLIFPFEDLNFKLYPSTLINKSSKTNYRKKITEKLQSGYFNKVPFYMKQCHELGSFKYIQFVKFQKDDKLKKTISGLLAMTYDSKKKESLIYSYAFPVCRELNDFGSILQALCEAINQLNSLKQLVKSVEFTTKDPVFFKQCLGIFSQKIYEILDDNKVYIQ